MFHHPNQHCNSNVFKINTPYLYLYTYTDKQIHHPMHETQSNQANLLMAVYRNYRTLIKRQFLLSHWWSKQSIYPWWVNGCNDVVWDVVLTEALWSKITLGWNRILWMFGLSSKAGMHYFIRNHNPLASFSCLHMIHQCLVSRHSHKAFRTLDLMDDISHCLLVESSYLPEDQQHELQVGTWPCPSWQLPFGPFVYNQPNSYSSWTRLVQAMHKSYLACSFWAPRAIGQTKKLLVLKRKKWAWRPWCGSPL